MARHRWPIGETVRWQEGEIHHYLAELPYWRKVPKEPAAHYKYRAEVMRRCATSATWRARMWEWSAADPVFWLNTFVFIQEPRVGESASGRTPFITWRHQDVVVAAQHKYFGVRHMVGPKSREQGASWLAAAMASHSFTFRKGVILGLGSKNMFYADDPNNPGSLGYKVDFTIDSLPGWMRPEHERSLGDHTWRTPKKTTNNVIVAEASTKDLGRANRYTVHTLDEAAFMEKATDAIQNLAFVTNQIIMPSTPNGDSGDGYEFFRKATTPSTWLRYILSWRDNPYHSRGMYTSKDGRLVILDKSYDWGDGYDWILDGRVRSPWYDEKWYALNCSSVDAARELDMDFGGSKPRPFSDGLLNQCRQTVRDPNYVGDLTFERADLSNVKYLRFVPNAGGKLKLWIPIGLSGFPPRGKYFIGGDPAAGLGGEAGNNAVLSVFDSYGQQVGEFVSNVTRPEELAQVAIALCYWFGNGDYDNGFLIWEKNGPLGMQFTEEVRRLKYPNIYWDETKDGKRHDNPGFQTRQTHETLGPLLNAMANRQVAIRSASLIDECGQYEWSATGRTWTHSSAANSSDPSALGQSHGDRAIAAAMCVIGLNRFSLLKEAIVKLAADEEKTPLDFYFAERKRLQRKTMLATGRW